jgi:hypothetical protein
VNTARQHHGKHIVSSSDTDTMLEYAAFPQLPNQLGTGGGSNTSIIALQVVRGYDKGTQCLRV